MKYLPTLLIYLIIGACAALVEWLFFYVAICYLIDYRLSAVIAFAFATFVNYLLCIKFGFLSGKYSKTVEFLLIYLVSAVAFIPNISVTITMVEGLGVDAFWAKISGTACALVFNFVSRQFWVFDMKPRWRFSPVKGFCQNRGHQNDSS